MSQLGNGFRPVSLEAISAKRSALATLIRSIKFITTNEETCDATLQRLQSLADEKLLKTAERRGGEETTTWLAATPEKE